MLDWMRNCKNETLETAACVIQRSHMQLAFSPSSSKIRHVCTSVF